jgi:hypothetical protein
VKFALRSVLATVAVVSVAGAANAVIIPGVYNTGLGVGGVALAAGDGQADANYTITGTNEVNLHVGAHALTYYNTAYLQDGPHSRTVNGTGDGAGSPGTTTIFSTTFNLVGFDSMNATISGQSLFDNSGEIFLNGNQIGGTITGFNTLTPFGTNANFFNAGLNTLSFVLHNAGGPEAFQVAGLTVTAASTGAVPEAATWVMMVAGFGLVGVGVRRRSRNAVAA